MGKTDQAWEKLGQIDPYYGVLAHPRFRAAAKEGNTRREFFALGEEYIEGVFATIRRHLDPGFAPRRALDFGCGVGRLTIPLARRIADVTALDVSDSMLKETNLNCLEAGVENVTMLKSNDRLDNLTGEFDFLHSYIVFQHIPRRRGERIFEEMLRRLSTNGVGALHFTYTLNAPRLGLVITRICAVVPSAYRLVNLLQGRAFNYPNMEMNDYNLNRLTSLLQEHGCHRVHLRFSDHGGHRGVVLFFQKEALPSL